MKKAAIVIAFKEFRDEEYFYPKEILESNGIKIDTFSNESGLAIGRFGGEAKSKNLDDLDINDYDAIIFVGGSGAIRFLDNEKSYDLIKKAENKNKIIAAICIAPIILAKAGVLKNKKAVAWSSSLDKSSIEIIKKNQGIYEENQVVVDGNIITGKDYEAAKLFGQTISSLLKQKDINEKN
ncbi:MAG: DJ-1/PfpI family protein [Candidatus Paceibacterota bacterium]